jgi:flagellar L-ring protein precursor FlgH
MVLGLVLSLGACSATNSGKSKPLPVEPAKALPLPLTPPPQEGAIWSPKNPRGLLADNKACNIGDIVTVVIFESTGASEEAQTQADKVSGLKMGVTSLFGLRLPQMKMWNNNQMAAENVVEAGTGNFFKGQGNTSRKSTFNSFITARVIQVLPNNNMMIQGTRHMKINNETEVVTLTGIIRPEDLDRSNNISSQRLAEARLEITGYGVVSDKQKQGWLTRILDHIWPW